MPIPIWQRLLGLLVYVLPWSDAIPIGQHLLIQFPVLQWLTLPALPLSEIPCAAKVSPMCWNLEMHLETVLPPKTTPPPKSKSTFR